MICIKYDLVIDALAILIGDYSAERKIAANLIMRIVFSQSEINKMLEDGAVTVSRRNDSRVRKWREKIVARGKCEECGSSKHLEAHHIIPWSQYPPGRSDMSNGECLCFDCHVKKHRHDSVFGLMKARGRHMYAKTD